MEENLGIVMFEGKMYNLDKMSSEELKELITRMEMNYKKLEKEAEIRCGLYN